MMGQVEGIGEGITTLVASPHIARGRAGAPRGGGCREAGPTCLTARVGSAQKNKGKKARRCVRGRLGPLGTTLRKEDEAPSAALSASGSPAISKPLRRIRLGPFAVGSPHEPQRKLAGPGRPGAGVAASSWRVEKQRAARNVVGFYVCSGALRQVGELAAVAASAAKKTAAHRGETS